MADDTSKGAQVDPQEFQDLQRTVFRLSGEVAGLQQDLKILTSYVEDLKRRAEERDRNGR